MLLQPYQSPFTKISLALLSTASASAVEGCGSGYTPKMVLIRVLQLFVILVTPNRTFWKSECHWHLPNLKTSYLWTMNQYKEDVWTWESGNASRACVHVCSEDQAVHTILHDYKGSHLILLCNARSLCSSSLLSWQKTHLCRRVMISFSMCSITWATLASGRAVRHTNTRLWHIWQNYPTCMTIMWSFTFSLVVTRAHIQIK